MDMHAYGNAWARTPQPTSAERAEELRIRSDELAAKRANLTSDLGALVYEETKTNPRARQGREVLYDGIAAIDREQEKIAEELKQLDARHRRDDAADARYCPFCGKPVTPEAIFCPQCGTRLAAEDRRISTASLTGQLEEVELDEPDMDFEFLYAPVAKSAESKGVQDTASADAPSSQAPTAKAEGTPAAENDRDDGGSDKGAKTEEGHRSEQDAPCGSAAKAPAGEAASDADQAPAEDPDAPLPAESAGSEGDAACTCADGDAAGESMAISAREDGVTTVIAPVTPSIDRSEKLAAAAAAAAAALAAAAENPSAAEKAAEHTFLDPGATQVLPPVAPGAALLDPGATQVIPVIPAVRTEAASFESDATEVLPETVDDAPDFDGADATRFMPAVSEHYEPDPTPHTYRSF